MVSPNPRSSIYALPSAVRSPTRALHETYWRISGLTERIDPAKGAWAILKLLSERFRQLWPDVRIIFRATSGFGLLVIVLSFDPISNN